MPIALMRVDCWCRKMSGRIFSPTFGGNPTRLNTRPFLHQWSANSTRKIARLRTFRMYVVGKRCLHGVPAFWLTPEYTPGVDVSSGARKFSCATLSIGQPAVTASQPIVALTGFAPTFSAVILKLNPVAVLVTKLISLITAALV